MTWRSGKGPYLTAEASGITVDAAAEYQIRGALPSPGNARASVDLRYQGDDYTLYGRSAGPLDRTRTFIDFGLGLASEDHLEGREDARQPGLDQPGAHAGLLEVGTEADQILLELFEVGRAHGRRETQRHKDTKGSWLSVERGSLLWLCVFVVHCHRNPSSRNGSGRLFQPSHRPRR